MRLTLYSVFLACSASIALFTAAQANSEGLYYYRNGVRHDLMLDQLRRVDLASGKGIAPRVVSAAISAKSLGDTTDLLIDLTTNTEQALPGGVVVTMPPGISEAEALAKLRSQGIVNASAVVSYKVWMIPSASGLPGLQLANRLHESGQFFAVEPNWWRKRPGK
jgi:hypothetical protein